MPRCLGCGNSSHFVSTAVPRTVPWNNGPNSGLIGVFAEGALVNIENQGMDFEQIQAAWNNPHQYFDSCSYCGSTNIVWP